MSNGVYYPPVLHNGTTNSIYNNTDWVIDGNDAKYVKLSGSTMTGGLSAVGLTSTGGINRLMSNLTLPTTYSSAPNTSFPGISQLGGSTTVTYPLTTGVSGTITNIATLSLTPGIYLLNYKVAMRCTATTATLTSFVMSLSTTNVVLDANTRISDNASHSLNSAGFNNEVANGGSFYLALTATTSYYLNYYSLFTGTIQATGNVTAIRIA
jgi:hypothetical protein